MLWHKIDTKPSVTTTQTELRSAELYYNKYISGYTVMKQTMFKRGQEVCPNLVSNLLTDLCSHSDNVLCNVNAVASVMDYLAER